jgi:hypothetical protein
VITKRFALVWLVALLASALIGCAKKDTPPGSSGDPTTASTATSAPVVSTTTVNVAGK